MGLLMSKQPVFHQPNPRQHVTQISSPARFAANKNLLYLQVSGAILTSVSTPPVFHGSLEGCSPETNADSRKPFEPLRPSETTGRSRRFPTFRRVSSIYHPWSPAPVPLLLVAMKYAVVRTGG